MNSVRERIMQEVQRRLAAHEFATVAWDHVGRDELPSDYDGSRGSMLALLEATEDLDVTAAARRPKFTIFATFAIPLADGETAQTAANNAAAELAQALHGKHTMTEGGEGTGGEQLAFNFQALRIEPNFTEDMDNCAAGTVEYLVQYQTQPGNLFAVG
ncbi:MAG: hypothetical protein AAFY38_17160 [Pseudomonadota bacterium]